MDYPRGIASDGEHLFVVNSVRDTLQKVLPLNLSLSLSLSLSLTLTLTLTLALALTLTLSSILRAVPLLSLYLPYISSLSPLYLPIGSCARCRC